MSATTAAAAVAPYEQVVENAQLFLDTLQDLHKADDTRFSVPIMGGNALDLHRLFVEVTSRGGLQKVIRNRQWKEIIAIFDFPSTLTNASFALRKYYVSLLHHYEEVYYFRKPGKPGPPSVQLHVAATPSEEKSTDAIPLPGNSEIWTGRWVTGAIDGKFDNGYLVTVSFGSEKLNGVLYHVPESQRFGITNTSTASRRRSRKRSQLASRDPLFPRLNRTGYNFFYSEHYARLKSEHHGQEKTISTKIADIWNNLSEVEKQVYQDKGVRDKQRYQSEMLEYKKTSDAPKPK